MPKEFLSDVKFKGIDDATFPPTDKMGIDAPFLLCAVGPPGSGKTHNLATYVDNLVKNHDIRKFYLLSPTAHNNINYFKHLKVKMEICDEMREANGFISKLKEEQLQCKEIWKEIKLQYPTIQKFETFVKFIKKNEAIKAVANLRHPNFNGQLPHSLEERAKQYMDQKGIKQKKDLLPYGEYILQSIEDMGGVKEFYEKPPIALMMCDDIQGTKLMSNSKDSPFMNFLIKHRHYFTSVMFGVHTIANGLPPSVRAQITDWMVFKVRDPKLIDKIHAEAAQAEGEPDDFAQFYKDSVDGDKTRFLMINKKRKPVRGRLGWGKIGEELSLAKMIADHKSNDPKQTPFEFTDGTNKKRKISLDLSFNKKIKK